jgi:DNA-binding NtrC family response regulator
MTPRIADQRAAERLELHPAGHVLLVDDQFQSLRDCGAILRSRGYEVLTCLSPVEGVSCLERGEFGFVVVNQGSRAFEGRAVLERTVEIDRALPVLVATRCAAMDCYLEAMQLGAIDYVEIPVPPEYLVRMVETHARPFGRLT